MVLFKLLLDIVLWISGVTMFGVWLFDRDPHNIILALLMIHSARSSR